MRGRRARVHPRTDLPDTPAPNSPDEAAAAPMDVDEPDRRGVGAEDSDGEPPTGEAQEGAEPEDPGVADSDTQEDADDPGLERPPQPAELLAGVSVFTQLAYLRRAGNMEVKPLSKSNYKAAGSVFAPFAEMFVLPAEGKLGPMLKKMTTVLREEKKHHDGACFQPDSENSEAGCGCMTRGTRLIKQVAGETDERKLASLFKADSPCCKLIRPELRALPATELAHMLALQLAATQRLATPQRRPAAAAAKRPREGDGAGGQTPGTATRGGGGRSATGDDSSHEMARCPSVHRVRVVPPHPHVCPDAAAAVHDLAR